jgi:hypothetical protein
MLIEYRLPSQFADLPLLIVLCEKNFSERDSDTGPSDGHFVDNFM